MNEELVQTLLQENAALKGQIDQLNGSINEICKVIGELTGHIVKIEGESIASKQDIKKILNRISNMPYEIRDHRADDKYAIPIIMTEEETFRELIHNNKSIARFGDGEFGLMYGDARWKFQGNNAKLAERLIEVVTSNNDNILIGLNDFYGDLSHRTESDADGIRTYITPETRAQHMKFLDKNRVYAHACISRNTTWEHVAMQKKLWDGKECVFIEGDKTRMGIGNDLFDNAKSIERILCPAENAFDRYDEILSEAKKIDRDKLILIALGPTASVLAYDMALCGYHAIDIGHADLSYEWLIRNNGRKTAVTNKYNNEYENGNVVEDIHDELYESQIIANLA